MIILGITHPISWNNAACIIKDGQLIAMAEEERFNRIKHAPRMPAEEAMAFCLEAANISLSDVDYFAIGFDSALNVALGNLKQREGLSSLNQAAQWLREGSKFERLLPLDGVPNERIVFVNHHIAHAASSLFASGFEKANIISLDGSGGTSSGILGVGQGTDIQVMKTVSNQGSWGLAYELVTEALGFRRHSGEGKTMGLAAYGTPNPDGLPFVEWDQDIPIINPKKRKAFVASLQHRSEDAPLTQEHKDLAATLQMTLETAVMKMAQWLYEQTGIRNLCLAGGTAMNCSMNGKLANLPFVDNIFIQPVAHDAGTALGAALAVHVEKSGTRPKWRMEHAYWGAEYDNEEIETALNSFDNISYHRSKDVCVETAKILAEGKVVGWFQGKFEVGARALGNRSILANPSLPEIKDKVNIKVKNREPWRPFAPSMLIEAVDRYVENPALSPFMILAFNTRPETRSEIISAVHVDGTCRPQTVDQKTNPRYWELIQRFNELTGIPVLLNTSFNVKGQPIVNTPHQAIDTFLNCGMDILALGDFLVTKESKNE